MWSQAAVAKAVRQVSEVAEGVQQGHDARVAEAEGVGVEAPIGGILRGILRDGLFVPQGMKVGDIDPRGIRAHCFTISDKARAIGGGVLEAILMRFDHL